MFETLILFVNLSSILIDWAEMMGDVSISDEGLLKLDIREGMPKHMVHAPCSGQETARTGFYTQDMVVLVHKAFLQHCSGGTPECLGSSDCDMWTPAPEVPGLLRC